MLYVDKLTTTQRGKIAELHVATALMAVSSGRLSPFEPFSDDHGVDLIVLDKITGKSLPIQIKSWFLMPDKPVRTVQFDVQKSTHSDTLFGAVVCVIIDPITLQITTSWVLKMEDIPLVATDRPNKFALVPSRLHTSKDKYSKFRFHTISDLTNAVESILLSE